MDPRDALDLALKSGTGIALQRRWNYYQGTQPRRWVTQKMAAVFGALTDAMSENYCSLAVNARSTRLEVTGWDGPGAEAAQALWDEGRWGTRQSDLFRWGVAYGRVYLISEDGPDGRTVAPNRPTLLWHYSSEDDPYQVDIAVKVWRSIDGWRATVYDQERVTRYVWGKGTVDRPRDPSGAVLDPDDEGGAHGLDANPVTVIYPYGLDAPVLMDVIAPVQDRINKVAANKFVAAEFGAFRQRVFFTRQALEPGDVKQAPDHAIVLDPGDPQDGQTRVQELEATDLRNYDDSLRREIEALFTLGLLPRHLMVNPGVAPSGEAIRADEGPLVEAVVDHQREFGAGLAHSFGLLGADAEPVWKSPEVGDDLATATTVRTWVDAGVPWQEAAIRYAGWSDEDVANLPAAPTAGPTATAGSPVGAALLQQFTQPTV